MNSGLVCFADELAGGLYTGFFEYNQVASETIIIENTVLVSRGMSNMIQASMPVNMSSSALANAFNIELRKRKKSEVTMPIAALLAMMSNTLILNIWDSESNERASINPPLPLSGT